MAINMNNKALHIGINYTGTSSELSGCINDVETLSKHVITPINKRLVLTDNTKYKPTRVNVLQSIKWLLCSRCDISQLFTCPHYYAHNNSSIVFTYSGHGSQVEDRDGDEIDKIDETMYLLDGNLTDDEIHSNLISKVPKNSRLWVVSDSCHSCSVGDLNYGIERFNENTLNVTINNTKICNGEVILLSGCRDNQSSADAYINGKYQGALTASINHVLTQKSYKNLIEFYDQIIKFMKDNNYDQRPVLSFGGSIRLHSSFFQAN